MTLLPRCGHIKVCICREMSYMACVTINFRYSRYLFQDTKIEHHFSAISILARIQLTHVRAELFTRNLCWNCRTILQRELQPIPCVVPTSRQRTRSCNPTELNSPRKEPREILDPLCPTILLSRLIRSLRCTLSAFLEVLPYPLSQPQQVIRVAHAKARVSRGGSAEVLGLSKRDMDLLPGRADVEPCEGFALELRYCARRETKGAGVELLREMQRLGRNHQVDVMKTCNHLDNGCDVGCFLGVQRVFRGERVKIAGLVG